MAILWLGRYTRGDGSRGEQRGRGVIAQAPRVLSLLAIGHGDGDADFKQAVAGEGVEVAWVEPAEADAAFALAESAPFDAVLLDAGTESEGAPAILTRLRAERPDLAVVAVTDERESSVGLDLVSAGADDFLARSDVGSGALSRTLRYAVERHRLQKEIDSLGLTDPVTGLRNRRGLFTVAHQVLSVAARYRLSVAAVTLHLQEGPPGSPRRPPGPDARRELTAMLRRAARSSDVVATVAPAEFVILMLDPGADGVAKMLDRLKRERQRRLERFDAVLALRWVVGVADQAWGTHELLENLLDRAGRAMYRSLAAEEGRTRAPEGRRGERLSGPASPPKRARRPRG